MLLAYIDGIRCRALPKAKGICTFCDEIMIAKCGKIKTWHWAHKRIESCDSWSEPESEWHRNWKLVFGKECCEIIICKNDIKHIADIKTMNGWIIELQNSKISIDTIEARENFYGAEMLWIINGINFKDNFRIFPQHIPHNYLYDDYSPEFEFYAKLHGFTPNYRPIVQTNNKLHFQWKYAHSVWRKSNRKIYIDFGNEFLFSVTEYHGDRGKGLEISKIEFIKTHGGDASLVNKLITGNME